MSTTTDTTGATPPTETESSAPARRTRNQRQRDRRAAASRRNDQRSAPEVSKFKGTKRNERPRISMSRGDKSSKPVHENAGRIGQLRRTAFQV